MHECSGGDHAIDDFSSRIARLLHDAAIGFSHFVGKFNDVEIFQKQIKLCAAQRGKFGNGSNAAFKFNARYCGKKCLRGQIGNLITNACGFVAQMDCDARVEKNGQI